MEVSDTMTPSSAIGRESWAKRIVKLAVKPPGTGGDATDSIMLIMMAVTYHTKDTSTFLLSATLTAANQNSIVAPGGYRSCPNGTPKFARRGSTPSFSVQVLLFSVNAAVDDAVDSAMMNVENVLFHRSNGLICSLIHEEGSAAGLHQRSPDLPWH